MPDEFNELMGQTLDIGASDGVKAKEEVKPDAPAAEPAKPAVDPAEEPAKPAEKPAEEPAKPAVDPGKPVEVDKPAEEPVKKD